MIQKFENPRRRPSVPAARFDVHLTSDDLNYARYRGSLRYAEDRRYTPKGRSSLEDHVLGMAGEIAVAKYLKIPMPEHEGWKREKQRGYDVGAYEVRTRSEPWHDLGLNPGNSGRFILVLGHNKPTMKLVGWIDITNAYEDMPGTRTIRPYGDPWILVPQSSLNPMDTL